MDKERTKKLLATYVENMITAEFIDRKLILAAAGTSEMLRNQVSDTLDLLVLELEKLE